MGRVGSQISLIVIAISLSAAKHPSLHPSSEQSQAAQTASRDDPESKPQGAEGQHRLQYEPECSTHIENRNSELCAQWKAADAATDAARWAFWTVWISGISGSLVVIALYLAFQSNRISSRDSKRAHPPELRFQNVFISLDGKEGPKSFRAGKKITGVGYVSNVGWDKAHMGWNASGDDGEMRSSQCVAVFHRGPLPMVRFSADQALPHNPLPVTELKVGEFERWEFEVIVPANYSSADTLYVAGSIVYWGSVKNRRATHFCRYYCTKERRFIPVEGRPELESIE